MTKLYIGNLPYSTDDAALKELFDSFGTVTSASVIMNRDTGRSKGFGFVEFEEDSAAEAAIAEMNGKEVDGRNLVVSVARPMNKTPRRDFDRRDRGFNRDNGDRY